ncbi:hypothetical protein GCM10017559_84830 [Streptosporangium longisporum]|uniref:Uncharacterized protein n=1 Tax=Streptosporangium longisporum TaxID=46187 RepID=A0ABP6LFW5_9ACTN
MPASRAALREHPGVLALALTKPPRGRAAIAIREQTDQLADAGIADAPGRGTRAAGLRVRGGGGGGAAVGLGRARRR